MGLRGLRGQGEDRGSEAVRTGTRYVWFERREYRCALCGWQYRCLEDAEAHLHRVHKVWDCGDFSVKVRTGVTRLR